MSYIDWNGRELDDAEWDAMKQSAKDKLVNFTDAEKTLEIDTKGETLYLLWEDIKTREQKSFSAEFLTQDESKVAHHLAVEFCKELGREDNSSIKVLVEDMNVFAIFRRTKSPILMISATFLGTTGSFSAGQILKIIYNLAKGYDLHVANLADLLGGGQ